MLQFAARSWAREICFDATTVFSGNKDIYMEPTIRIKIIMTDGAVFQCEKEVRSARVFLDRVVQQGFFDATNSSCWPAEAISNIEVMAPPEPPEFSSN